MTSCLNSRVHESLIWLVIEWKVKDKKKKKIQWNQNYCFTTQLPITDQTYKEIIPLLLLFFHIFKCIRHKHLNPSYHIMTALFPSHHISFKMLHYNYYIKCRTSIRVLNTYFKKVQGHISVGKIKVEEHGKTPSVFPLLLERAQIRIVVGDLAIYRWKYFC